LLAKNGIGVGWKGNISMRVNNSPISNRKFGGFFVLVFVLAAWHFFSISHRGWAILSSLLAVSVLLITIFSSYTLTPLNNAWMALGNILGRIVSPIVLGFIYLLVITPIAMIGRQAGRDPLHLKRNSETTCWIQRDPVGPDPDSFYNQF